MDRERKRERRTGGGVKDGEEEIEECRKKKALAKEREKEGESTTERVGMDSCIPLGVKW